MNLWVVFITGLTVGGLTCLAVQGGLLASIIAAREDADLESSKNPKHTIFPTVSFLISKLIAYTALGFVLGAFGGAIGINQTTQIVVQFIAGLYMIAISLNLLNVHPIFRYVVIQPPRFLTRKIRNQSKSRDIFAPAILGAMTIFIPCGTTLAMEALAISSASGLTGALILGIFVLGTTPLFFGVGFVTTLLGDNFKQRFLKIAAFAVLYLGIVSVNSALVATGSDFTLQSLAQNIVQISQSSNSSGAAAKVVNGVQNVDITVTSSGYSPTNIKVKKDMPVKLNLKSTGVYSCASAFRIPALGIERNLQPNGSESVQFTPTNTGQIAFNCSMGMYRGVIDVM